MVLAVRIAEAGELSRLEASSFRFCDRSGAEWGRYNAGVDPREIP
jgi:hypothetical protein